jgi:hypothetical protein
VRGHDSWNIDLVGHTDLNGSGDVMHVNIGGDYAYVGHMGAGPVGTSVLDIRDPSEPRVVTQIARPEGSRTHKVQLVDDILLVNHERSRHPVAERWSAGMAVYDVSKPAEPRQIGFFPAPGTGVHRMTYWEPPFAYLSASDEGYGESFVDQFLIIVDLSDPSDPAEVGRWWFPGMRVGAGEIPRWPSSRKGLLHHALIQGDRAYCGWKDLGLVILDISDREKPELVSHTEFGDELSSKTHTALPVPDRPLLLVADESTEDRCQEIQKQVRVMDIRDDTHPSVLSVFPIPEGDYCARGGRFGPHNLHEHRPGSHRSSSLFFLTYFNAGLRVVDLEDPSAPVEVGYFVPAAPEGQEAIQLNDVFVTEEKLIYVTDRLSGGLFILDGSRLRTQANPV